MANSQYTENSRAKAKAAQLAHGIKYQGPFFIVSSVLWVVFLILLSNGALS